MRHTTIRAIGALCLVQALGVLTGITDAATFRVDSSYDDTDYTPGDGVCGGITGNCTFRAAIQEANALPGHDLIDFPIIVVHTIPLDVAGAGEDAAATGDLDITEDVTITGAGVDLTIIDGLGLDRVFHIHSGVTATISGMTIRNGRPPAGQHGGGIYSIGSLEIWGVAITGNESTDRQGGGIYVGHSSATLSVTGSTISGNTARAYGGGVYNRGTATLTDCTLNANTVTHGGGAVLNSQNASLTIINSTLSGNSATYGGAFHNDRGTVTLTNSTLVHNTGPAISHNAGGHVIFTNTLLASNPGGNCYGTGTFTSDGHNLESGDTCGFGAVGDLINTNPLLGPLADNGGPTLTHALLTGSPARDAAAPVACPGTDQRGELRPQDGDLDCDPICDIGAYEALNLYPDCDGDGTPDVCELPPYGTSEDCNENTRPDECDIIDGTSQDCDGGGVPDECQPDCDGDGTPDVCALPPHGLSEDCNENAVPDDCEPDFDLDGVIDDCDDDIDDDGVLNEPDVCDYTPSGTIIRSDGTLRADCDGDCDVDLADFAILQLELTGS